MQLDSMSSGMVGQPQNHATLNQNSSEFNQLLQSLLTNSAHYEICESNMDGNGRIKS